MSQYLIAAKKVESSKKILFSKGYDYISLFFYFQSLLSQSFIQVQMIRELLFLCVRSILYGLHLGAISCLSNKVSAEILQVLKRIEFQFMHHFGVIQY